LVPKDFDKKQSIELDLRIQEANISYHLNIEYWKENVSWFSKKKIDEDLSIFCGYVH
jgi:hypothetical protein